MILYFSATGNCQYVANKIAEKTEDRAISMTEVKEKIVLADGEMLGIVFPTYFWGLPSCVEDFIKQVQIENGENSHLYCVVTYGTTSGQADHFLDKLFKKKGLRLCASYNIKTVDNWTVLFSVNDKEEIVRTLAAEEEQLKEVLCSLKKRERVFITKDKKPLLACKGARSFYNRARKTGHLHVEESCISCGLCAKGCPVSAIEMQGGKPVWVKDKCAMCFGCLHRCPTFAIQYDDKTKKNGQYVRSKYQK